MGFLGGPTDRAGDSFNVFVRPLPKLCISDVHLHVREKHECAHHYLSTVTTTAVTALCSFLLSQCCTHQGLTAVGFLLCNVAAVTVTVLSRPLLSHYTTPLSQYCHYFQCQTSGNWHHHDISVEIATTVPLLWDSSCVEGTPWDICKHI